MIGGSVDGFVDLVDFGGDEDSVEAEADECDADVEPYCDASCDRTGKEDDGENYCTDDERQKKRKPETVVSIVEAGFTNCCDRYKDEIETDTVDKCAYHFTFRHEEQPDTADNFYNAVKEFPSPSGESTDIRQSENNVEKTCHRNYDGKSVGENRE